MGYNLYITRRKDWSGKLHDITAREWLAYVEQDPELSLFPNNSPCFAQWSGQSSYPDPWLDWSHGNIYSKNPDQALIAKMVAIARDLHAQVQGDDGEIYQSGNQPPIDPTLSTLDRLRSWLRSLRPARRIQPVEPPFKVGDVVVDVFRKQTTVVELDPKANHGLGKVKVRYDDGREAVFMLSASGLSPLPSRNGRQEGPED